MKRLFALLLALTLAVSLVGCGPRQRAEDGKLQVVCTVFPYYDFARQIGGDDVDVTLLVAAGKETHSFEPTPLDVITLTYSSITAARARRGWRTFCPPPERTSP